MKHPINDIVDESCKYVCEIMEKRGKKEGRKKKEDKLKKSRLIKDLEEAGIIDINWAKHSKLKAQMIAK